jgi:CheY-like chemotaxis protein
MQGSMFARQVQPDLVILDINLPGGGGEKVYERLRTMPGALRVPVLVYTGEAYQVADPEGRSDPPGK